MTQSTQPISPLRQCMIEDMNLRKLALRTQTSYIRAVNKLADYLGHLPDTATAEDLRQFQLHHLRYFRHRKQLMPVAVDTCDQLASPQN